MSVSFFSESEKGQLWVGGVLSPVSKDFSSMSCLAFTPRVNREEDRDGKSLMYASCTPNHRDNRTSNNF